MPVHHFILTDLQFLVEATTKINKMEDHRVRVCIVA